MPSQYKLAYGQTVGQARGIQEHTLAMIPIMKEQAEMELGLQQQKFEQEIKQTKAMNLLSQQLEPDPVFLPAQVIEDKPVSSSYLIYAVIAFLAYTFLRK